jgi:hypothetical protein
MRQGAPVTGTSEPKFRYSPGSISLTDLLVGSIVIATEADRIRAVGAGRPAQDVAICVPAFA